MTLNVLWSDDTTQYLICDSARTHNQPPRFTHTNLEQLQTNNRGLTVEEGAQKIIPLTPVNAAALCGSEHEALTFLKLAKRACEGKPDELIRYAENCSRFATTVAVTDPTHESPFQVYQLDQKVISSVARYGVTTLGSLNDRECGFLSDAIGLNLIASGQHMTPRLKLVHALAYAMNMSAQFNLTAESVGGAFFGAMVNDSKFLWQPDIMYVLYSPQTIRAVFEPNEGSPLNDFDAHALRITVQVRNNVGISASLRTNRIALSTSELLTPDVRSWVQNWATPAALESFTNPEFFVFIPTSQGQTVIVENTGHSVRATPTSFDLKGDLVDLLASIPDTPFRCVHLLPNPEHKTIQELEDERQSAV